MQDFKEKLLEEPFEWDCTEEIYEDEENFKLWIENHPRIQKLKELYEVLKENYLAHHS